MNDLDAFVSFLQEEERRSYDAVLADDRSAAIDFYNGLPYGDEEEGRSQVVTRDVAETVDYMTVSLVRTMVSSDKVVEFECSDKAIAEQATLAVSRTFFQGQRGYQFIHDWAKAGLLEKASVAKCCVVKQPPKRVQEEVSVDELTAAQEAGLDIIEAEPADEMGSVFKVTVLQPQPPKFLDYVVPNEQYSFAQDATDLDEDCVYSGFHEEVTLSKLASEGFVTDDLADWTITRPENTVLAQSRNVNKSMVPIDRKGANRKVVRHEEYSRYDLNGDGIAELLLTHRVGNKILTRADTGELAIEVVDEQPGVSWCPFPMSGSIIGQSLADKVMDIQLISSVTMRQVLDGFYFANNPSTFVHEDAIGDNTIDDLLTVRPGAIKRWKGAVQPQVVTGSADIGSGINLMELLRGDKESRTGITRLNQGIDADALNKTASGTAMMQAQGQQIEEYIARNFAESFARLMLKKYRLMRKYGEPFDMVVDGEVVKVDPQTWPDDMQVAVRVGLGTGRKDQRIAYRMQLLEIAQAAVQGGSRIFDDSTLYNNLKGLVADMSLGSARDLLIDPESLGPPEEKPDPEMAKAQADAMMQAEKLKAQQVDAEAKNMLALQKQEADLDLARQKLEYDLAAAREKSALEADLARDKAETEAQLAIKKIDMEYQLALIRIANEREIADSQNEAEDEMTTNRPGGALDE